MTSQTPNLHLFIFFFSYKREIIKYLFNGTLFSFFILTVLDIKSADIQHHESGHVTSGKKWLSKQHHCLFIKETL